MSKDRNQTMPMGFAGRKSSATPSNHGRGEHPLRAHGMLHRGVVVATYVQLDGPQAFDPALIDAVTAVYCDVLLYSTSEGMRGAPLRRVPVAQDCGIHDGKPYVPRAAKLDLANGSEGRGFDIRTCDPQNLDGDHVLIQYIDDHLGQPIITKRITHPRMGQGNENLEEAGHRMKLKLVDGTPDFWKHHGSFIGFDNEGSLVLDTTRAHAGDLDETGNEVPAHDAEHGNVTVVMGEENKLRILIEGKLDLQLTKDTLHLQFNSGESLTLTGNGASAQVTLGNGAQRVANADRLQAQWEVLKAQADADKAAFAICLAGLATDVIALFALLGVPSPWATTMTPVSLATYTATPGAVSVVPTWSPNINSTKLKVPDL